MKKIHKAVLLLAIAAGAGTFMLAGCKKQEEKNPIEITLMHGWGGTLKTHSTMQQIYAEFSKENPDIVLNTIPYADSRIVVEKANDMLAVGKMPDIISTNGLSYYVENAAKQGRALDLMPYIDKDPAFAEEIHPSVYETWMTDDGRLYTVPDALEVSGYWYNKKYLEAAEVTEIPRTWEGFIETAKHLQAWCAENSPETSVCALDNTQMKESLFLARLAGENGNGMTAANDAGARIQEKTLQMVMGDIGKIWELSRQVENIENARQQFSEGKSIFYFNGVWESDVLGESDCKEDFAYANYPTNSGESLSYVSPSSGYVLAAQEDPEKELAEIRFLKYMLSEEVQMKIAVQTGQAPSNPHVDTVEIMEKSPMFGAAFRTAYDADIQIKTIWSIWPEEKVDIAGNYLANRQWGAETSARMAQELNKR